MQGIVLFQKELAGQIMNKAFESATRNKAKLKFLMIMMDINTDF